MPTEGGPTVARKLPVSLTLRDAEFEVVLPASDEVVGVTVGKVDCS